jgi:hypothetical protein
MVSHNIGDDRQLAGNTEIKAEKWTTILFVVVVVVVVEGGGGGVSFKLNLFCAIKVKNISNNHKKKVKD